MSALALLAAPFSVALLLVGIHTYFGLHILRRGVIFVDLALAQIAALGGLVAFLVGLPPGNIGSEIFALVFALAGAALLSAMRPKAGAGRVPQEALIGLTYAFASALALLAMAEAPEGAEHLRESLTGTLLWTDGGDILKAAAVYGAVALVHVFFWRRIALVSDDHERAAAEGIHVGRTDFIFYATFAITVTHSVRIAGVLLVFVFLVAPATLAMTWSHAARFSRQLVIGWIIGVLVCLAGMALSLAGDFTAGPTIIAVYAVVLSLSGLLRWLRGQPAAVRAQRLGGVLAVMGAAFLLLWGTRALLAHDDPHHGHPHEEELAAATPPPAPATPEATADTTAALDAALAEAITPEEKEAACVALHPRADVITAALRRAADAFDRLGLARCLRTVDHDAGVAALRALAEDAAAPELVREEARHDIGAGE